MGKKMQGSNSTVTKTKAGKKAGAYVEPPRPNPEKKRAREAGRQQFVAHHQLTEKVVKIVYDKKKQLFVEKLIDEPVPFIYDETRKQFVYSPRREEDN